MDGNFDGGAQISGKWLNAATGETINVVNSVIDGESMVIISDKGEISMEDFSRDYVQMDESAQAPYSGDINANNTAVPQTEYVDFRSSEFKAMPDAAMPSTISNTVTEAAPKKGDINAELIEKFFNKIDTDISIDVHLVWDGFGKYKDTLMSLIDFFDVPKEEISKYIVSRFAKTSSIVDALSTEIGALLSKSEKNN